MHKWGKMGYHCPHGNIYINNIQSRFGLESMLCEQAQIYSNDYLLHCIILLSLHLSD